MNKRSIRAFALGIMFAAGAAGSSYFFAGKSEKPPLKETEAKALLKEKGYAVLSNSYYENLVGNSKIETAPAGTENNGIKPQTSETNQAAQEGTAITYQLQIVSGMNSVQIAALLANAKIIADAQQFEEFLASSGYSTKIQLGTFTLTNQMSNDEIAKIITKGKA